MGRKKIFILVCMLTVSFYALADSEMNDLGGGVIGQVGNKATALAAKIHTAGKSRVAVLDFTSLNGDEVTELGRLIVELLNVHLASSSHPIAIVDRLHLENVLKEQKLSKSGLFNPDTSAKIGELSGVDAVIIGTHTKVGDDILVSFKVIDTETATNIGSEILVLKRSKEINKLYGTMVSPETDAYVTSDGTFVNSASFYTDRDTVRCQGLGTFKSYPHALAAACWVQPAASGSNYICSFLGENETWKIAAHWGTQPIYYDKDSVKCDGFPEQVLEKLVKENGRY